MAISKLSARDIVVGGDQLAIGSASSGDDRRIAVSVLQEYLQENLTFSTSGLSYTTQYAVPSATGFNVPIDDYSANDDVSNNIHLILTPTAGYATGTITLPLNTGVIDKQEVLVNCTQQITALTVDGNGATAVTGEPTAMGADDFFRMKYDLVSKTWYRVG